MSVCKATTKKGQRCRIRVREVEDYCTRHTTPIGLYVFGEVLEGIHLAIEDPKEAQRVTSSVRAYLEAHR